MIVVETVREEVPSPMGGTETLDAFRLRVSPLGVTVAIRLTTPVKLLTLVTETTDVPEDPLVITRLPGLAPSPKSGEVEPTCTASPVAVAGLRKNGSGPAARITKIINKMVEYCLNNLEDADDRPLFT